MKGLLAFLGSLGIGRKEGDGGWGGIEPPTRGFSSQFYALNRAQIDAVDQSNQQLSRTRAQWNARNYWQDCQKKRQNLSARGCYQIGHGICSWMQRFPQRSSSCTGKASGQLVLLHLELGGVFPQTV
jgi:hypothetical protein